MLTNGADNCMMEPRPRRHELYADGVRLSYLEWGTDGRPLVLLHGITSSAGVWWQMAPALVALGYHVYGFDLPGHGHSDETSDHRIDALAGLLGTALGALDISDLVLIGHSWGGAMALALASAQPARSRLARVALIDPALRVVAERGPQLLPSFLEGVAEPPDVTLPPLRRDNPHWHECDFFWKSESLQRCRVEAVRGLFLHSGGWDLAGRLAQVEQPVLVLQADPQYTVISADMLPAIEQALRPGIGQIQAIPGTDHNMFRGSGYAPTIAALSGWLGA